MRGFNGDTGDTTRQPSTGQRVRAVPSLSFLLGTTGDIGDRPPFPTLPRPRSGPVPFPGNFMPRLVQNPARGVAAYAHPGGGGYKKLYGQQIVEAACMAHVRRKFHDVIKLKASAVADEALARIGALYDIEDRIRGMTAHERRDLRQQHARPILDALKVWMVDALPTVPQKQKLAEAIRYALSRWEALGVYIDDGRVEIDNNIAERAMRPIGIGRKNWLFAGSDVGGERIANILTLIETAKMHGHNPEAYLTDVLACIRDHPANRLDDLLPWNMGPRAQATPETQ